LAYKQAAIEKDNHKGLKLHAVIEICPKETLLKIAKDLDEKRASGVSGRDPHAWNPGLTTCLLDR